MPARPAPMLASPVGNLPALAGWTIEPKWDGIRVIAVASPHAVRLWSRNGIDKSKQFADVSAGLMQLARKVGSVTVDGEVIATDRAGNPLRFQALQSRLTATEAGTMHTAFIAFDCLAHNGKSLLARPWTARRKELDAIIGSTVRGTVRKGTSYPCGSAGAKRLLDHAVRDGWEGVIVKQMDAPYRPGKRSPAWRKIKLEREQEFVIGGFTPPTNGADRDHLGALILGYFNNDDRLVYAGKVGTGFTRAMLAILAKKLKPLQRQSAPFETMPKADAGTVWVRPKLVAQIRYNEMTVTGLLRQPSFLGLRDDKDAHDVHLEADTPSAALLDIVRCGASA